MEENVFIVSEHDKNCFHQVIDGTYKGNGNHPYYAQTFYCGVITVNVVLKPTKNSNFTLEMRGKNERLKGRGFTESSFIIETKSEFDTKLSDFFTKCISLL